MNAKKFSDRDEGASYSIPLHQDLSSAGDCQSPQAASSLLDDDDMSFPPPPPAQLLNEEHIAIANDDDDEFPLPPPPPLSPDQEVTTPVMNVRSAEPISRHHSLMMQSLSVRLAERGSAVRAAPPPVAAKQHRMTMSELEQAAGQVPGGRSSSDLLSQIQRGVSLRRTISNDRSAPHLRGKR